MANCINLPRLTWLCFSREVVMTCRLSRDILLQLQIQPLLFDVSREMHGSNTDDVVGNTTVFGV